jgi:hypothetical protein
MPDLFDISHGAGGIWELHKWNGSLELNTEIEDGDGYLLSSIDPGFGALAEIPNRTNSKVGRPGENFNPASPGGITRVYKGEIRGANTPSLRHLRTALIAAFGDTTTYGTMDLIPFVGIGDNSPTARFYAVVLSLDPPEEITSNRFDRDFTLVLRQVDPRIYYLELAVDETGNPATFTNPGSAPSDPVLHVAGASGTVVVSDGTRTLTFRNCPSGTLDIDFGARTAKVGAAPVELVTPSSDWWDSHVPGIPPGAGSISQTGGSSVRVTFIPATWG